MMPQRDRPTATIEITRQMVDAGVVALEEFSGSYGPMQLVEAVYTAMTAASAPQTGPQDPSA